jgi:hypothetical protein
MKNTYKLLIVFTCIAATQVVMSFSGCTSREEKPVAATTEMTKAEMIAHGKNLVSIGGCNDCHTPKIMTQEGPIPDTTRLLAGSPQDMKLPPIDTNQITPGKWYLGSSDLTAWVGPWGISYSANLTPDNSTGIGGWTDEIFIKMFRNGKFMGIDAGRPIMPPMPVTELSNALTDNDLKCILAYLRSLPAIKNQVPAYIPPNGIASLK